MLAQILHFMTELEALEQMRNVIIALSIASAATIGAAAQTAQQPTGRATPSTAPNANATITATGCVAAGPNDTFTLTAPADAAAKETPTGTTATTPAGTKVAKTITYTLNASKPDDLKAHVGHTVEVTGVEAAPQVTAGTTDKSAGAANTQGTTGSAGGAKPKVETTAQTQIVVRQLTVNSVKMIAANCSLVK